MSKRKILSLALTVCMIAILAVGGTLAYFTDSEQKTNIMTVGNIEINVDEWTYVDGKWEPFEDNEFTLYPIDNVQGEELYNKMVYTANTSPSEDDAYLRNIVLFEANTELALTKGEGDCCFPGIHYGFATNDKAVSATDGKTYVGSVSYSLEETVTIDGKEYWVAWFEEKNGEPIAYDAALATLSSVWMDENVTSDQIDGWGEEGEVDIIVLSQGIQATGLTHDQAMDELGEITEGSLQTWLAGAVEADVDDWTQKTK